MIYSLCVYLIFALLLFWNCKLQKATDETHLLKSLNALRGILALEIIVGHVIRDDSTYLFPLGKFMICSVAFFFFVSAFGLVLSYKRKKNYLHHSFLISKPFYLFLLAVGVYLVNATIDLAVPWNLDYSSSPIYISFFSQTNWYIWELIAFYILFYVTYRFFYEYRLIIVTIATTLGTIGIYATLGSEGIAWVASAYAFPLGLIFGEHYQQCRKFLFSAKGILLTVLLAILGGASLLLSANNFITIIIMRNAICLAVIFLLIYVCEHVVLADNKAAQQLTRFSTELYLAQFICLRMVNATNWSYTLRIPATVASSFILALCILHPLVTLLNHLTGRRNKSSQLSK